MSKRFTDTNKWDHSWYRKLSPKFKCAWNYLLDKCDHAGVWIEDFEAMVFNIGEEICSDEFMRIFQGKICKIDSDKYLIQSFIDYQYGQLNPNNKVHKSVIDKLSKYQGACKGLGSTINDAKEKEQEQEKDKEKDKEKESSEIPSDILNAIKMQYQFPDDLIEEVRKDAWLQYLASDKPDKNWRRWIGNYFKHEKEKIRNFAINKANEKISIANTPAIDELVNRVIQNSHLQALEFQKLFTHQELELIRSVGGSRFISSANDFTLSKIKKDLKENAMSNQNSPDRIDTGHAQVSFGTN